MTKSQPPWRSISPGMHLLSAMHRRKNVSLSINGVLCLMSYSGCLWLEDTFCSPVGSTHEPGGGGFQLHPQEGVCGRQLIDDSSSSLLSLFLTPSPVLSKINKNMSKGPRPVWLCG
ncbi:unnamed protein product [Pipistrellus nathusii]|uniref:Uncharacterized protein n=1 Tax=Pipistrellus nathusii TaxID=59473 RepID=A0ABN9Z8Z0_PIPNA